MLGVGDDCRTHRRYMEHCLLLFLVIPHHGHTLVTISTYSHQYTLAYSQVLNLLYPGCLPAGVDLNRGSD